MCILQTYIFSFYDFLFFISLSTAKMLENVLKRLFAGYFAASDFGEIVEAVAEILRHEV